MKWQESRRAAIFEEHCARYIQVKLGIIAIRPAWSTAFKRVAGQAEEIPDYVTGTARRAVGRR